ncbi:hypothetical protein MHY29_10590 [Micrococcus sp. ACRRV]|uniref:hypothetical protein n=1 Tax=Micrococcus sp. ACRRV TaxID=2918203 RepID=UPI001EF38149|nr:hypothetical protein [Micrococcus sp. ACRRV]MCG7423258.1 hypothetical protein [Micrococcus sp. ACRRV]
MRWDGLFEDLEARWSALEWDATRAEAAELTRGEWAALTLEERLRGARGETVRLHLAWGEHRDVRLGTVGDGWVSVNAAAADSLLVPLTSVVAWEGPLGTASTAPEGVRSRPGLPAALRQLARARAAVRVVAGNGVELGEGTIDRVGRDHVDLARHPRDEARRAGQVRGRLVVPLAALGLVATPGPLG